MIEQAGQRRTMQEGGARQGQPVTCGPAKSDRLLAIFKGVVAALGQRELLGQGQRPHLAVADRRPGGKAGGQPPRQSSTTPPMLQIQPSPRRRCASEVVGVFGG